MTFTTTKTRVRNPGSLTEKFPKAEILLTASFVPGSGSLGTFFSSYGKTFESKSYNQIEALKQSDPNYTLVGYDQIWDLDIDGNNPEVDFQFRPILTELYLEYLNGGGKLYLQGENDFFEGRNSSIRYLVNDIFGANIGIGSDPNAPTDYRRGSIYFTGKMNNIAHIYEPSTLPQMIRSFGSQYYWNPGGGSNYVYSEYGPGFGDDYHMDWTSVFYYDFGAADPLAYVRPNFADSHYAFWLDWSAAYNSYIFGAVPQNFEYHIVVMLSNRNPNKIQMRNVTNTDARVIIALDINYYGSHFYKGDGGYSFSKGPPYNTSYQQGQNMIARIFEEFSTPEELAYYRTLVPPGPY